MRRKSTRPNGRTPLAPMEECAVAVCRVIYGGKCMCENHAHTVCQIMIRAALTVAAQLAPDAAKAWVEESARRDVEKQRGR